MLRPHEHRYTISAANLLLEQGDIEAATALFGMLDSKLLSSDQARPSLISHAIAVQPRGPKATVKPSARRGEGFARAVSCGQVRSAVHRLAIRRLFTPPGTAWLTLASSAHPTRPAPPRTTPHRTPHRSSLPSPRSTEQAALINRSTAHFRQLQGAQRHIVRLQASLRGFMVRRHLGRQLRDEHVVMMMLALESEQVRLLKQLVGHSR